MSVVSYGQAGIELAECIVTNSFGHPCGVSFVIVFGVRGFLVCSLVTAAQTGDVRTRDFAQRHSACLRRWRVI